MRIFSRMTKLNRIIISALKLHSVIGASIFNRNKVYGNIYIENRKGVKLGCNNTFKNHVSIICNVPSDKMQVIFGSENEISQDVYLMSHYGTIQIGNCCFIGQKCQLQGGYGLEIGNYVMIGPHTVIVASNHIFKSIDIPYKLQGNYGKGIIIKDNVWVGANCTILDGVEIGENSIIGAGSTVTRNIPSNSLAVGSPAKVIKQYSLESQKWEVV